MAVDRVKLGLGISERGERHVDILRDGKVVAPRLEFAELAGRRAAIEIGLFAAPEPGQECLCSVRQVELVWKKLAAER